MYNFFNDDNEELDPCIMTLGILGLLGGFKKGDRKRLKPEIKEKLSQEYKSGDIIKLKRKEVVEVISDPDADDVYYDQDADEISIFLKVRYVGKEYQNVNMNLLRHGTCARDKYNQYPGVQHYTKEDCRVIMKIPDIWKKAYDVIQLTID